MTRRRKDPKYKVSKYETIPQHWCIEWDKVRLEIKVSGYPLEKIKIISKNPTKRINRFAGMKGEDNFE